MGVLVERKQRFLEALKEHLGIVATACSACGMTRQTYYNWRHNDAEFKAAVDEITETQIDYVEDKLLNQIKNGNTTATIFYLKTKGKKRGYSEIYQAHEEEEQPTLSFSVDDCAEEIRARLRAAGKYDEQYEPMIMSTAMLYAHLKTMHAAILSEGYSRKIYTRDGNIREEANPKVEMMRKYALQFVEALTKLGISPDSKQPQVVDDAVASLSKLLDEDAEQ